MASSTANVGTQVNYGTTIQPGETVNKYKFPANAKYQPGAGRTVYEFPKNRAQVRPASNLNKYTEGLNFDPNRIGTPQNVGREAETSFTNIREDPTRSVQFKTGTSHIESGSTEGLRQRRPFGASHAQSTPSNSSSSSGLQRGHTSATPQSFEFSDTVPLLGTTGIGTANTATTGTTIGSAVAGIGGALALGGISASIANRIKEKGVTLPGSDYIGPGNEIKIDAPRNEGDAVAKEHDVAYDDAQKAASFEIFKQHIERADYKAIRSFKEAYSKEGRWQNLVGHYGLRAKAWLESFLKQPIYPSFTGKWENLNL